MSLSKKIDFALIIEVKNANPNGDPLYGNRPRTNYDGIGEISDVCLKRKLRDRLQEKGETIFVQSDEKALDGMKSLQMRAEDSTHGLGKDGFKDENTVKKACEKWFDVRTFGQVFAFKSKKSKDDGDAKGVSIAIRGPMTIQPAFSLEPVNISSLQITKSVSGEGDGSKRSSDTMGTKHRVDSGIYVTFGAITPQLAERTGFSDNDAAIIKTLLPMLFEGDASSARPEGSMIIKKVIWWEHDSKAGLCSSAKVHKSLKVAPDGSYTLEKINGLKTEEIDGF